MGERGRNGDFKAGEGGDKPLTGQKKSLSYGQGVFQKEGTGVEYGLSDYKKVNPQTEAEPAIDYTVDSFTGNATERLKPRESDSVSSKGKSFDLE